MPALSPTMEQGNIVKWLKKEGELAVSMAAFVQFFAGDVNLFCKSKIILSGGTSVF